jgi:hypothetical protein
MNLPFLKRDLLTSKSLICLSSLSLIPVLLSFCFLYAKQQKIGALEERVLFLQAKMEKKKQTRMKEELILAQIQKSKLNHFLDHISSLSFLGPEQQKWKMCLAQLGSSPEIQEKYAFLENMDNRLKFTQESSTKASLFEESELLQEKSIKINGDDLKNILSSIENVTIGSHHPTPGSPQVLITSFSLKKSNFSEMQEKIYTLQMQLLTRQKAS